MISAIYQRCFLCGSSRGTFHRLGYLRESRTAIFSVALDGQGDGIAAAEAESGDAALEVAALEFIEQRKEDARAGSADGMAEGDRAAVDVDLIGIEAELARNGNGGDGEGFVQFHEIDILVAVPA